MINGAEDSKDNINGKRVKPIDLVEDGKGKTSGMFVPTTTMLGAKNQLKLNSKDYNKVNLLKSSSCASSHQLLHYSKVPMYFLYYLESSITVS
jgi:hypothetical protein